MSSLIFLHGMASRVFSRFGVFARDSSRPEAPLGSRPRRADGLTKGLPPRTEAVRKLIHAATVGVPVLAWFLPRTVTLSLLAIGVSAAILIEWARTEVRWARYHFFARTRRLLRPHERRGFSGATYMAVGYLFALLIFPLPVAVVAMLYTGLGDAIAALVGKHWGRHRTRWGKSWEGATAMLLTNFGVGLLVPGVSAPIAAIGATVATVLEFAPLPMDDNLRVILGGGFALWGAMVLTGSAG